MTIQFHAPRKTLMNDVTPDHLPTFQSFFCIIGFFYFLECIICYSSLSKLTLL